MVAVHGPRATPWALFLQPQFAHEPRHVLPVAVEVFTSQQGGDASIAIRRPRPGQTHNRRWQRGFNTPSRLVIMTAASIRQDPADLTHGIVMAEHLDDLSRVFDRACKMLVDFFKMSFSSVKRPA
jgi:hypothetical protein